MAKSTADVAVESHFSPDECRRKVREAESTQHLAVHLPARMQKWSDRLRSYRENCGLCRGEFVGETRAKSIREAMVTAEEALLQVSSLLNKQLVHDLDEVAARAELEERKARRRERRERDLQEAEE